jgi:hypothetical protein
MSNRRLIDPGHGPVRGVLRVVGPLLMVVGGLFILVGAIDFFSAFSSMGGPPTKFWCLFVGFPLLGIGGAMTKAAYLGRIARYYSQEITPVATDTFSYAAHETKDGIRDVVGAISEGLRDDRGSGGTAEVQVRCHKCNHENDADAKFCSECGSALAKSVPCPGCGELNDHDARFCDNCGRALLE